MDVDNEILMQSGTNELEVLLFGIGKERFGINVAKVREVIRVENFTKPPLVHPFVEGVIELRGRVISIVSIRKSLGYDPDIDMNRARIIITEFHQTWFGFLVDSIDTITRISWENIVPPTDHTSASCITGIAHVNETLVQMLDFEKIAQTIHPFVEDESEQESSTFRDQRSSKSILIAEDSVTIRQLIHDNLVQANYINLTVCENGREAWEKLESGHPADLLITDIEMPQMDGLYLTRMVRERHSNPDIPVVIFSSIISDDNRKKGEAVGANRQISKPEIHMLVEALDAFLFAEATATV